MFVRCVINRALRYKSQMLNSKMRSVATLPLAIWGANLSTAFHACTDRVYFISRGAFSGNLNQPFLQGMKILRRRM